MSNERESLLPLWREHSEEEPSSLSTSYEVSTSEW